MKRFEHAVVDLLARDTHVGQTFGEDHVAHLQRLEDWNSGDAGEDGGLVRGVDHALSMLPVLSDRLRLEQLRHVVRICRVRGCRVDDAAWRSR